MTTAEVADELRELLNYVAILEKEYSVSQEDAKELRMKVERIVAEVQNLGSEAPVIKNAAQPAAS